MIKHFYFLSGSWGVIKHCKNNVLNFDSVISTFFFIKSLKFHDNTLYNLPTPFDLKVNIIVVLKVHLKVLLKILLDD